MRVLFIHQYFKTPEEGGGIRSYYMCKALVEQGHEVEVISAHNVSRYLFKDVEGIRVHYLPVFYENKLGFLGRIYAFSKFLFLTIVRSLSLPKADICYASSSPLTVGIIAIILKKIKGVPFIFEVMDLWPEAPIQMGFIKSSVLKKGLYWLEKKIYDEAKVVVAASPGMADGVKRVAPFKKVITIPNMSDCEFFKPAQKDELLVRKFGVENKFVCCYTGAIGLSNRLEVILEVAEYLKNKGDDKVKFLIAGEGAFLSEMKTKSIELGLNNISFLGYLNKDQIAQLYNISDLNLIIFNKQPILETNSPNKFFDGIAAGLPTAIGINGWIRELCEEYRCGIFFNPDKPEEFVNLVKELGDREMWNEYSRNARRMAEERFDKKLLLKDFSNLFKSQRARVIQ